MRWSWRRRNLALCIRGRTDQRVLGKQPYLRDMARVGYFPGKAGISRVISLVHTMVTPMSKAELCENVVIVYPAENNIEVTLIPRMTVTASLCNDVFTTTDIPYPMPGCFIGFMNLGITVYLRYLRCKGRLLTSNEHSNMPAALFCIHSVLPKTPLVAC